MESGPSLSAKAAVLGQQSGWVLAESKASSAKLKPIITHSLFHSFMHSFNKYFWSTCYMQGTILGMVDTVVINIGRNICSPVTYNQVWGEADNKESKCMDVLCARGSSQR